MRWIITIRKRNGEPGPVYYLSRNGFRCYTAKCVAVYKSEMRVREDRDYFARQMPDFELGVERLPAGVRNVEKAVLAAVPV